MMQTYSYDGLYKMLEERNMKIYDTGISDISIMKIEKGIALSLDQEKILCDLLSCSADQLYQKEIEDNIYEKYFNDYSDGDYNQYRKNSTVYFALASLMFDQYSKVQIGYRFQGQDRPVYSGSAASVIQFFGSCRCSRSYVKNGILNVIIGNYS